MTTTPPLPPRPDDLERQLGELTAWRGGEPELWKKAMEATERAGSEPWIRRAMVRPIRKPAMAAGVLLIVGLLGAALLMPSLGKARQSARQLKDGTQVGAIARAIASGAPQTDQPLNPAEADGNVKLRASYRFDPPTATYSLSSPSATAPIFGGFILPEAENAKVIGSSRPTAQSEPDRQVVRKAMIELTSDDVRGTFAKAAHLVSEAGGEYVENSTLTGEGKTAQANLTLRVAASRLGAMMTSLRELGIVKSENTTGEDVTAQVVDLEARVRNEQRVEQELLQLLEKRADAPLKDVLELRSSLAQVRDSIERMIGQREKLGRLVSLASVLVVIRTAEEPPKPAPEPPAKAGMGEYFSKAVSGSWRNGLEFLADTVAAGVALIVGGLVWWTMLGAVVYAILCWRRRLAARCV